MITTAFCKETNSIIKITDYNPLVHKTLLCNNLHPLTPKLGNIKRHHFAHQANTSCTHKNKTEWHLRYQSLFPQTEVYMPPKISPKISSKNSPSEKENPPEKENSQNPSEENPRIKNFPVGKYHIADILVDGTVIEIQHSPISKEEIRERETFYEKMIWIFDVKNSVTGTEFICRDKNDICILKLNKKYLFSTEKETYYDCGKYLCQKLSIHGKYAICKILTYETFGKRFIPESHNFNVLMQDPDFEFSFLVEKLEIQTRRNQIFFISSEEKDYSPFQCCKYIPNRYILI